MDILVFDDYRATYRDIVLRLEEKIREVRELLREGRVKEALELIG